MTRLFNYSSVGCKRDQDSGDCVGPAGANRRVVARRMARIIVLDL